MVFHVAGVKAIRCFFSDASSTVKSNVYTDQAHVRHVIRLHLRGSGAGRSP